MRILSGLFVILSAILFTNCEVEEPIDSAKIEHIQAPLVGDWELISYHGGLLPGKIFEPGNGFILNFTTDKYNEYAEGKLTESGTYSVIKDKFFSTEQIMDRIIYNDDEAFPKTFFQISADTLFVYYAAPISVDGLETVYLKK